MEQDKKKLGLLIAVILVFLFLIIATHWLLYTQLMPQSNFVLILVTRISGILERITVFRLFYIILLFSTAFLFPSFKLGKKMSDQDKVVWSILALFTSAMVIVGLIPFYIYNLVFYPLILFFNIICVTRMAAALRKRPKDEEFFKGISNLESEDNFFFELDSEAGPARIHKAEESIFIDGGPGSGKSHFLIKFFIAQCIRRNYACFCYDYEGDPTKKDNPILSTIAYSEYMGLSKDEQRNYHFAFINFTDPTRTARVNVLSRKYYTDNNAELFIKAMATTLMKNLEPSWKEKTDFWAGNAINYVSSVMYKLYKSHSNEGYNTIPHAISICLSNSDTVFRWLESDKEIAKTMSSMITAWKLGAQQQTAGAVSSAQLPLALLYNKNIYWVLSKDEFSLDITNREKPTFLCVGNSPELKDAISPAISTIISVLMNLMNNPGKAKAAFIVDELPTIVINGLDRFMSTVRKHFVSCIVAIQDYSQLVRDYGERSASVIKTTCGTSFQGKTGNDKTAEEASKSLGEIKRVSVSYSDQSSGSHSVSESMQRERVLQAREIKGQPSGHFFGIISNGQPPFFFTKFKPFHQANPAPTRQIPRFSLVYNTGNEEMDLRIHDKLVAANFQRIEDEVATLLAPFEATN